MTISLEKDIKEKDIKEEDIKEEDIKEEDIKEKDIKEEDIKEEDIKEEDIKEKDIKEEDIKEEDIKEEDIKEEDIKEEDIKEEDIKEEDSNLINNQIIQLKERNNALKIKIENINDLIKKCEDKNLRICAEMENLRRRSQKDIENAHKFGLEKFIYSLLPVLDSMEKALESSKNSNNIQAILEGVQLTMKMLIDVMHKFDIKQIQPKSELFDPNKHEAIGMKSNLKMKNNQVMSVLQTGYELNNRVIRPARVLVVKND